MKGCVRRLLRMVAGVVVVAFQLLVLALWSSMGVREVPPRPIARSTEPDVTVSISEAYLDRKVQEVVREVAPGIITDAVVDLQPGEKSARHPLQHREDRWDFA